MAHIDGSSQRDQASRLRQLIAGTTAPAPVAGHSAHVVAVVSGKGGVGKTMVAVNLSIAMAARGHRVALFDMDMGLANADIILGVETRGTWSDVLMGRRSITEVAVQAPGNISFVPGASGVAHMADLSEFERHQLIAAMRRVEQDHDVVVLDCGAGISRNVMNWLAVADTILVVTTPEPTALTDAYAMIMTYAACAEPVGWGGQGRACIGLVVNSADSRHEGHEVYERVAGVCARFLHLPVDDFGYILRDEHVPAAVRQRRPVLLSFPRSPAGACLMSLAVRLSGEIGRPQVEQSLFKRVMGLFS